MNAACAPANPHLIAFAYFACGSACTEDDPLRALDTFRDGLAYTRQHRLPLFETLIARNTAGLEAAHGDLDLALDMFTASINGFHQSGDAVNLRWVFAHLAVFFDRIGRSETAATAYGITTDDLFASEWIGMTPAVEHLREVLDTDTFDECVRTGAAMNPTEAVHYANQHIQLARHDHT